MSVKIIKPETKLCAGVAEVTVNGCIGKGIIKFRISFSVSPAKRTCRVQIFSISLADGKTKERMCIREMVNAIRDIESYIDMARFPSVYNLPLNFNLQQAQQEILGYLK